MPRCRTVNPVALAATACSNEILEPSANDVTMEGYCPTAPRNLSVWQASGGVLQPLHVADDARLEPQSSNPAHEVHLEARFVTVAGGEHDAMSACMDLKDGADRRVDLSVQRTTCFPWANASSTT